MLDRYVGGAGSFEISLASSKLSVSVPGLLLVNVGAVKRERGSGGAAAYPTTVRCAAVKPRNA